MASQHELIRFGLHAATSHDLSKCGSVVTMQGNSSAGFIDVAETFRNQLGRTTGGASLAVYHRGELVVDLWGGLRTDDGYSLIGLSLCMFLLCM